MKNKKGSHVGMVLSFTMFIIFLIFVYVIVGSPIDLKKQNGDVFENLQKQIINEISGLVYTVRAYDFANIGGCVQISNPKNDFDNLFVIVKNESKEISSEISGSSTLISGGKGFMKIYYSDNFFEKKESFSGTGCVSITSDSISGEKRVLEEKILLFFDEFENNYSKIKDKFEIPNNVDFYVQFEYDNGTIFETSEFKELKTEIFAKKIAVNYLDRYANEKGGNLILRIW